MAWYKGTYTDQYVGHAQYYITGPDSKTVIGKSTQYYKGGMKLTVESGTLDIRAETRRDTAEWTKYNFKPMLWKESKFSSVSGVAINLNVFGTFNVLPGFVYAQGKTVTSCGIYRWVNAYSLQVLVTALKKDFVKNTRDRKFREQILAAIKYRTVAAHTVVAQKSQVS